MNGYKLFCRSLFLIRIKNRPQEIEIYAKMNYFQIDRANLGFRDKMKLFAEQIGEKTPKNRLKASSAEREIEQIDENFI